MKIYKLGCNWGSKTPNFFPLLLKLKIVITVPERPFQTEDLIILAEGHSVSGIARPNEPLKPVTNRPEWRSEFEKYQIPFDDTLLYSHAELYPFENKDKFDYKLQQGIVQVQKEEIKRLARELWAKYSNSTRGITPTTYFQPQPLNQILYGPPGTGKTYQTKSLAVEILDGNAPQSRAAITERYGKLYKEGRIKFITFHQGTTYEDFIEGIKPVLSSEQEVSEEGDNNLNYSIIDGIFKRMCVEASYEYAKRQSKEQSSSKSLNFSQLYDELVSKFAEELEGAEVVSIPQKSGQEIDVVGISSLGNIIVRHQQGERKYTVSKNSLRKIYNAISDLSEVSNVYTSFRDITGIVNASAYWAVLNQIYQLQEKPDRNEFEGSELGYEEKRSVFQDIEWSEIKTDQDVPKYLLIIDEINRGNIAAVLGELITLLESDKRGGSKESIEVTLPYSKSNFAVPPNLYILGTMNTADRSVEALDTALRRRFSFTEVGPKPELLSPLQMIADLWTHYNKTHWDDANYLSAAENLYQFLGTSVKEVDHKIRKNYNLGHTYRKEDVENAVDEKSLAGINLETLLRVINHRITRLIDRDHTIGHAYFMGIATAPDPWAALKEVFHRNLLPLMQEYFFGDHGKIGLVLGSGFVKEDKAAERVGFANFEYPDMESLADRKLHKLVNVAEMKPEEFQQAVRNILPAKKTESDD